MQKILDKIFGGLEKHPGWNVNRGYPSFVRFDFGRPHLRIGGMLEWTDTKSVHKKARLVDVHGDWHLHICYSKWDIWQNGKRIANNDAKDDRRDRACAMLKGQKIKGIIIYPSFGRTVFDFDLGGVMNIHPLDRSTREQWHLWCPNKRVLSLRSDGCFSYYKSNLPLGDRLFKQVCEKMICVGSPSGKKTSK